MQKENENKLSSAFIQNFVRGLIYNSYKESEGKDFIDFLQIEDGNKEVPAVVSVQTKNPPINSGKILQQRIKPVLPPQLPPLPKLEQAPINIEMSQKKVMGDDFRKMNLPPLPPLTPERSTDTLRLGKIVPVLLDPKVISIECQGPDKNLIVNKAGQIQSAQIRLSREEINKIMEEVSEKTRIPLEPGLFRAAVKDLIVTAVISNYVGTRFIIQKRIM